MKGDGFVRWSGVRCTYVRSTINSGPRTGIYLKGACDLPAMLLLGELIGADVRGSVAILKESGTVADARADVILQTLDEIPDELTRDVADRMSLPSEYFRSPLFEPTFSIPGKPGLGESPKSAVVLSLAPNVVRRLYRHRVHGYLLDPGAWWLGQLDATKGEKDGLAWFRENFKSVGRLSVEEFVELFTKVVVTVQERTNAHVLVFNVLTVEPGLRTHSYRLRNNPDGLRRREFNIALAELSRELGFHVVDVDRTLKRHGLEGQQDFDHFPLHAGRPIAAEGLRILRELEVL